MNVGFSRFISSDSAPNSWSCHETHGNSHGLGLIDNRNVRCYDLMLTTNSKEREEKAYKRRLTPIC